MIRLLAFQWAPERSGKRANWVETYPCQELCGAELKDSSRRDLNCARVDLPVVNWGNEEVRECWMGLPRDPDGEAKGLPFWNKPRESMEDGCPAAWYRSPFAESLRIYLPTPGQNGSMESPLINSSAPRLVVEAVQTYKRYKALVDGWYMEVLYDG